MSMCDQPRASLMTTTLLRSLSFATSSGAAGANYLAYAQWLYLVTPARSSTSPSRTAGTTSGTFRLRANSTRSRSCSSSSTSSPPSAKQLPRTASPDHRSGLARIPPGLPVLRKVCGDGAYCMTRTLHPLGKKPLLTGPTMPITLPAHAGWSKTTTGELV